MTTFVRWTVVVFAFVLVVAAVIDHTPAYAAFHAVAAGFALAAFAWRRGLAAPWFALGFGAIDLYQAAASWQGWFPQAWFQWTPADDLAHLILGPLLIVLGGLALVRRRS